MNDVLPYGPHFTVEKIECRNHLLRNSCQKLLALTKRTEYPVHIRKFIQNNILRFRSDITKAVQHRKTSDLSIPNKIAGLKFDKYFLSIIKLSNGC